MGVEQERSDTKSDDRNPEVDQVWRPQGQGDIKQHDQRSHAEVDARTGEPRKQDVEIYPASGKTTSSSNVTRPTESQITQDGMGVDLGGEDLEHGRQ